MVGRTVTAEALGQQFSVPGIEGHLSVCLQKRGFQGGAGYAVVDGVLHKFAHMVGDGGQL